MSKETGGSAFPTTQYSNSISPTGHDHGMTLRDYFASKALDVSMNQVRNYYGIKHEEVAVWCYQMADAMLKAREQ